MCGIIGEYRFDRKEVDRNIFGQKLKSIKHRGPDGEGTFFQNNVALGHVRLSIIDLSESGAQPMVSKAGNVLTFNGELYNYQYLKPKLKQQEYRGNSDTEVLLNFLDEGLDYNMLEGMFALAHLDKATNRLILVRDKFGIKPLYYHRNENRVIFSSEIKALLLDPEYKASVNNQAVREHLLLGYSLDNDTVFEGIKRLKQGASLTIDEQGVREEVYFDPVESLLSTEGEFDLEKSFDHSIELHSISDVNIGLMLSGGFDSNLLLHRLHKNGLFNAGFAAYNAGSDDEDQKSEVFKKERNIATAVTDLFNVRLEKIPVAQDNFLTVDEFTGIMEEPICNPSGFLIEQICKKSASKVLLSGHGADEFFAGYRRHNAMYLLGKYQKLFRLGKGLLSFVKTGNNDINRVIEAIKDEPNAMFHLSSIGYQSWKLGWIKDDFLDTEALKQVQNRFNSQLDFKGQFSKLKRQMMIEIPGYLASQNLITMDKFSMNNSIEARVPFIEWNLFLSGMKMNEQALCNFKENKLPLRKLARKYLPEEIFSLPKSGFTPSLKFIVGRDEARDLLLSEQTAKRGIVNVSQVEKTLKRPDLPNSYLMQLLNLAIIESWQRQFID